MKLGFLPPFLRPHITSGEWVASLAGMLEAQGVESVWAVEHVIIAEDYEPLYPYSDDGRIPGGPSPDTVMPDPLEWLSWVAASSSTLRVGTAVVVASQHSAAILAKRAATLDALSGGRLLLGVGLGWQREEYEAIGVPYRDRGRRLDETIEAMRALWASGPASYEGRHIQFERVNMDTKPARAGGIPIHIGGSSEFAARRAGRHGDGFFPFVISPDDLAARIEDIHDAAREAGRDPAEIEISVWPGSWDASRSLDLELVRSYVALGASRLILSSRESGASSDIEEIRAGIDRYQQEIIARL
ncbi:MAG: TIGR03619 family F420-dependent LLM class oxidoreductase [Chloroflexi bacterium]|nr:TIGR03619 family F420-dependent LLM class oxidoreductase [Chloroflexota bacterium]